LAAAACLDGAAIVCWLNAATAWAAQDFLKWFKVCGFARRWKLVYGPAYEVNGQDRRGRF